VPRTATRQVPPEPMRATHEQQFRNYIDRNCDAFMLWTRQLPPDAGERETEAEKLPAKRSREVRKSRFAQELTWHRLWTALAVLSCMPAAKEAAPPSSRPGRSAAIGAD